MLTVGGTSRGTLGWFASDVWRHRGRRVHELFLLATSSAEGVLVTLLHEACHVHAHANGIRDTSRNCRYHNRRFAELAMQIGLTVMRHPVLGHGTPGLAPWARVDYADLLSRLERPLLTWEPALRPGGADGPDGLGGPASSLSAPSGEGGRPRHAFASCRCLTHRGTYVTIRVARGSWQPGMIRCAACDTPFDESRSTCRPPADRDRGTPPAVAGMAVAAALGFVMCPTGKRGYADEAAAVAGLRAIRRRTEPDRNKATTESAAFLCGLCGCWHLTATPHTKRRTGAPRSRSRR